MLEGARTEAGEQREECAVTETKEEIELMLQVLEEPRNSYELSELQTIAILSNKYDLAALRSVARLGCW